MSISGCQLTLVCRNPLPKSAKTIDHTGEEIESLFEPPLPLLKGTSLPTAKTIDFGLGGIERRCLEGSTILNEYVNLPAVEQVVKLERQIVKKKISWVTTQTVYGITGLTEAGADVEQLLSLVRQHWHIENRSDWVRDVTVDEDHSEARQAGYPM